MVILRQILEHIPFSQWVEVRDLREAMQEFAYIRSRLKEGTDINVLMDDLDEKWMDSLNSDKIMELWNFAEVDDAPGAIDQLERWIENCRVEMGRIIGDEKYDIINKIWPLDPLHHID